MLTPRHATDASSVASLSTSSCHCHTAAAQRAASMEATPTEQQSTHSVPRFDRDIRERPSSTSSGVRVPASPAAVVPNPLAALRPLLTQPLCRLLLSWPRTTGGASPSAMTKTIHDDHALVRPARSLRLPPGAPAVAAATPLKVRPLIILVRSRSHLSWLSIIDRIPA